MVSIYKVMLFYIVIVITYSIVQEQYYSLCKTNLLTYILFKDSLVCSSMKMYINFVEDISSFNVNSLHNYVRNLH